MLLLTISELRLDLSEWNPRKIGLVLVRKPLYQGFVSVLTSASNAAQTSFLGSIPLEKEIRVNLSRL